MRGNRNLRFKNATVFVVLLVVKLFESGLWRTSNRRVTSPNHFCWLPLRHSCFPTFKQKHLQVAYQRISSHASCLKSALGLFTWVCYKNKVLFISAGCCNFRKCKNTHLDTPLYTKCTSDGDPGLFKTPHPILLLFLGQQRVFVIESACAWVRLY